MQSFSSRMEHILNLTSTESVTTASIYQRNH